ncbi:hypothetical protein BACPLE_03036 [Phocaeicola plebeius DSM 17135]|uniref:Uncharacterized protein n=1 Tax=Phocaeicola plebeius (strain DSM 17135 / JCM 12973 / CCUG 54634 / M2) TaxID=484018 RepID=B5D233_PHOPM|nr:hypothetical protein BACPLE_03036 [Phocaeicola plebeius DSM 17135]
MFKTGYKKCRNVKSTLRHFSSYQDTTPAFFRQKDPSQSSFPSTS